MKHTLLSSLVIIAAAVGLTGCPQPDREALELCESARDICYHACREELNEARGRRDTGLAECSSGLLDGLEACDQNHEPHTPEWYACARTVFGEWRACKQAVEDQYFAEELNFIDCEGACDDTYLECRTAAGF